MEFVLPFDDFSSMLSPYILSQKIVVVSVIGKLDMTENRPYMGWMDNTFYFGQPINVLEENINLCRIQGKYVAEEKVLYLNLFGPWNSYHLISVFERMIDDMDEMGFLDTWNLYTNSSARALLFMFSMSHIVIIDHPSSSPDIAILQLLKLLSYVRPKYQASLTNLLSRVMSVQDEWFFHGRLCSPRLLFVFKCPHDIRYEEFEEEQIRRIKKLERTLEDRIYLALRKSRIVKYVCNRAFYSIAPNDEFVYVENPDSGPQDELEKFLRTFRNGVPLREDSDSDNDEAYLHDFSSKKKGHTFRQFLQKHITKAHVDGFYDNLGKYTHVKPFFQRPTLKTWFEAANAIIYDREIGLGNDLSFFPSTDNVPAPDAGEGTSQSAASLAVTLGIDDRASITGHALRDRQGEPGKLSKYRRMEDRRKNRPKSQMKKASLQPLSMFNSSARRTSEQFVNYGPTWFPNCTSGISASFRRLSESKVMFAYDTGASPVTLLDYLRLRRPYFLKEAYLWGRCRVGPPPHLVRTGDQCF